MGLFASGLAAPTPTIIGGRCQRWRIPLASDRDSKYEIQNINYQQNRAYLN